MGIFDRIILTLYTFSLTFISFVTVLIALGWDRPLRYVEESLAGRDGRLVVGISGAVVLIVSLRLLYLAFRRYPRQTIVHETAMGEVRISLDAIENLVRKAVHQVRGVREVKAAVASAPGGVAVRVRASVTPDINIPEASDQIQNTVKNYVRNVVGIGVQEVKITVDNIGDEHRRGRLE